MLGVIQARLGSTRLPGKVLMEIKGKPLLSYCIERVKMACDQVLVLCPSKDFREIWKACASRDVEIKGIPGKERDVLRRLFLGIEKDCWFFRICGDSPLIDPAVIRSVLSGYYFDGIVSNTRPNTWPRGQCVELIDTNDLEEAYLSNDLTAEDEEHVTPWMYRHRKHRHVVNPLGDFSHINMCVDTQEDFDRIKDVIERMTRPHITYGWHEIMEMMA